MGSGMRTLGRRIAGQGVWQTPALLPVLLVTLLAFAVSGLAHATERTPQHSAKSSQATGKVYRWVDDRGVVHFGDQVPPEYAPTDRQVLNKFGVTIGTEQGTITEEELAAERKAAAEKAAILAAARRDDVLLSTYLSVEEIEALRNRRMELIEGQISVTTTYLGTLKEKLHQLQVEAGNFKPYSNSPNAEQIDDKLAQELSDTVDSIALYEKTLQDTRMRQSRVILAFDADITRFKELRNR